MGRTADDATTSAVELLQAARTLAPALETEQALAKLESALFGAPKKEPVIDRYVLLHKLGQGGSGVVYLAHDPKLDRKVAIKLLASTRAAHGGHHGRARLLREAQAMARSPHPNVVAVYDVGTYVDPDTDGVSVFIVMEYVDGPTLADWLAENHPWREVVSVFIAAGRGLAAAHKVGVTHRDFKPANAIVGRERGTGPRVRPQVRVVDFGLARGLDGREEVTAPEHGISTSLSGSTPLTMEGTVLGTPKYMAPEQHAGLAADPLSDQFSFCAALWEGVFRTPPFWGRSIGEIALSKTKGPRRSNPEDLPLWIGDVLERGLDPDPRRRWPSMDALLDALQRGLRRRRRRTAMLLATAIVAPLVVGGWLVDRKDARCTGATSELEAHWDDDRRARVRQAFVGSGLPYADVALERVHAEIDGFAAAWLLQHREACVATNVRAEQSTEELDLRMACLDRQLRRADALFSVLETADATTIEHAVEAAQQLPDPTACGDLEALRHGVQPPDAGVAGAVEAVRDEIARVDVLRTAGRFRDALAVARAAVEHAQATGYAPVLAETLRARGGVEDENGLDDAAARSLASAHETAVGCGHDREAMQAARMLVWIHGHRRGDLELALEWARTTEAAIDRVGGPQDRAELLGSLASAYQRAGDLVRAKEHVSAALDLMQTVEPPAVRLIAVAHNNLGDVLRELGDTEAARGHFETAQRMWHEVVGHEHPQVALAIHNLGTLDLADGQLERAEARFHEAIAIRERALGPDHPHVAMTLSNLGIVLRRLGRIDEAREVYARALAIHTARFGADDPAVAPVLHGLGLLERARGDHVASLQHLDRALAIREAGLPDDHPQLALTLISRAHTLVHLGRREDALASFQRGIAIEQRVFGKGSAKVAADVLELAGLLRELSLEDDALAIVTRARVDVEAGSEGARRLDAFVGASR